MMIIGNKIDIQKDRAVSKEEGKALAEDFGAGFLEVSVSTSKCVLMCPVSRYFLITMMRVFDPMIDRRRRTSKSKMPFKC